MKTYIILLIMLIFLGCKGKETDKGNAQVVENKDTIIFDEKEQIKNVVEIKPITQESVGGFLFVNIGEIYFNLGSLSVLNKEKDTIVHFKNKRTFVNGNSYESIEESGKYENLINTVAFDPEYSLFILKCDVLNDKGFYEVDINGNVGYINNKIYSSLLLFKTPEKYVLEAYPLLSEKTPMRVEPNGDSDIVTNYLDYSYVSIKIEGDWLKIKDDKDCYFGEEPSKENIIGWVRWRKDGKIIIEIAHSC